MAEIKYEVVQRVAVLSQRPRGWERQLNLISWNDGEPKYDIRDWSPDGTRMGKGISLSHDELAILRAFWRTWSCERGRPRRVSGRLAAARHPPGQ